MDFYIAPIPKELNFVLGLIVITVAVWRGGLGERAGAAVFSLQVINEDVAALRWSIGWPIDVITFAAFLALVLLGRRYWTIWALASVVLSLVTDVLDAIMALDRWAYLSAQLVWYYVLSGSLFFGALTYRRPTKDAVTAPSGP